MLLKRRVAAPCLSPEAQEAPPPINSQHYFVGRLRNLLALVTVLIFAAVTADATPPHVPGRILIKPKTHSPEAALQSLLAAHGSAQVGTVHQLNLRIARVPEEHLDKLLAALQHNPNIEFAEPDYILEPTLVPNDTYYSLAWHLPKISAPAAWDVSVGTSNVTVAILDSGIDATHPDLAGRIVAGYNFYDNNTNLTDVTGHGTAVAGTAVANGNNAVGVAALTWNCFIMPLRIADTNGYGTSSAISSALTWAADHGARVANISYGNVTKVASIDTAAEYFQSKG